MLSLQEQTAREEEKDVLKREYAELKHVQELDLYKKILYGDLTADAVEPAKEVKAETVTAEPEATDFTHTAKQRIADYHAYSAPAKSRKLFEGIVYKDGRLQTEEGDVITQPAPEAPRAEAAVLPAPDMISEDEDDATPTRRTMETLHRAEAETVTAAKPHLFSVLSTKAKIALVTVLCAVVMVLVFICVNTAILNSIHADNDSLRSRLEEQQQTHQQLSEQVEQIESYQGDYGARVEQYAKDNGMVKD